MYINFDPEIRLAPSTLKGHWISEEICNYNDFIRASYIAQWLKKKKKKKTANAEDAGDSTRVRYLGQEDPPEEEMVTNSSILAWKCHRQRTLAG